MSAASDVYKRQLSASVRVIKTLKNSNESGEFAVRILVTRLLNYIKAIGLPMERCSKMIAPNIHSITGTDITSEFDIKQVADVDTRFSSGGLLSVTVEFLANSKWTSMAAILFVASITVLARDHIIIQFLLTMIVTAIAALSCLLYTSPSPRDATLTRMPSSA